MRTLHEMYEDLISNKERWSYYQNPSSLCYNTLFNKDDSDGAFDFIEEYFSLGRKKALFDDKYIKQNIDIIKGRAQHIVSTYLLGIIIAESFGFDLNKRDFNNANLKYLWFLACLYHDIGYVYEETHSCENLRKIQKDGLEALADICSITYCEPVEFRTYEKSVVNLYLKNRAKCTGKGIGKMDHGIVGGLMLYDRLRKNYEQAQKKELSGNKKEANESFKYNGLFFSKEHFKYYAEAADAIISHNIWASTLKDYLKAEKKECLMPSKINENNKIAYILAIADTIEPIKRKKSLTLSDTIEPIKSKESLTLENISYEKIENGFVLTMPNVDDKGKYKNLRDLPNWVDVYVNEKDNMFYIQNKI